MKAGILRQTHPDYDAKLWALLSCLYDGGFDVADNEALLAKLLPKHVNESDVMHLERQKCAAYINYLSDIIDYYGAQLFSKTLTMQPGDGTDVKDKTPYEEFAEDADGRGSSLQELMARAFVSAAVTRKAIVAVDLPRNEGPKPRSRKEERDTGADRPRAFLVDPDDLLDWRKRDDGTFEWAIMHRVLSDRESPEAVRNTIVEQWKVWSIGEAGLAQWKLFQHTRKAKEGDGDAPKDEDEIPEVDSGTTSFKRVPLCEFKLSRGLWIGDKAGPLVREHFQRRTTLVCSQQKSLMAVPVLKLGPEIGAAREAQPSEAQQNPWRGSNPKGQFDAKGWIRIGADDSVEFAEPTGGAYEVEADQLDRLVDEVFRVSHLMAQSVAATGQAMQRSGASKVEDRNATEVVLEAFGDKVGKFAARLYDTISEALGDDVYWVANGLSSFRVRDRAQVVEEGKSVNEIRIPSKTFRQRYLVQMALRLIEDIGPEDEELIRNEIEAATEKEGNQPPGEFGDLENLVRNMNRTDEDEDDEGDDDAARQPAGQNGRPPGQAG